MNSNIKDKVLTTGNEDGKKHQAYAMELSRLRKAKENCVSNNDCFEYNKLGGDIRFNEIEKVVEVPRKADELRRKTQSDTNPNNMYQEEQDPTAVSTPSVSRKSDHSGGEKHKILNNTQALSEEILNIRYLIEYMDNNKKQKI